MGQCNSTAQEQSTVDPALANCKSHLYAKHLEEQDKNDKRRAKNNVASSTERAIAAPAITDPLEIFSYNGALMTASGARFYLKGVNWFGCETEQKCPQGLWAQSMSFLLDFCVNNDFNAIRLPLCTQTCLNLEDTSKMPSSFDTAKNANLNGKTFGGLLDVVIQQCAQRGIWVLLDMHRNTEKGGLEPLWYNSTVSEAQWIQAWTNLAKRYLNQWNILGCDLKNELHGAAAWRSGNPAYDWDQAAVRCGNAILAINPKLLIFVEGTCGNNFPVEYTTNIGGYWWGGDLSSAAKAPITLNTPNKLVYSPHCYGPTVFVQSYFNDPSFPANMPPIWNSHWGHILANKPLLGPAVVLSEWGGQNIDAGGIADATWHAAFFKYIKALGATDQFYWCLNPTSTDTGGLLANDWATPVTHKLNLLANLIPLPGRVITTNGIPTFLSPGNGQPLIDLSTGTTTPPTTTTTTTPPVTTTTPTTNPVTTTPATTTPATTTTPTTPIVTPPAASQTFTLTSKTVSTWSDASGALLSQIDYTLTNSSSKTAMCTLGLEKPGSINQIWNVTKTATVNSGYTIFTLPSWVTQAGGVAGGGSAGFGGIFDITAGSPKWAVFS